VSCIRPCKIIAEPTGMIETKTPIRIRPPSIPKIDDKKAVPKVAKMTITANKKRLIIKPL
jgi:hypothetical protein